MPYKIIKKNPKKRLKKQRYLRQYKKQCLFKINRLHGWVTIENLADDKIWKKMKKNVIKV